MIPRIPSPEELVDLAIESHVARVVKQSLVVDGDESFFVSDLGQVTRQHRRWTQNLPGVPTVLWYRFICLSFFC